MELDENPALGPEMIATRRTPFPFEAVRDLLGILRAMYSAEQARGQSSRRLQSIRKLGRELRGAVDLALEHGPGTLGHAAAWARAERATAALGDLVDSTTPLAPTLDAARARVAGEFRAKFAGARKRGER
jgi:hypothetical protein